MLPSNIYIPGNPHTATQSLTKKREKKKIARIKYLEARLFESQTLLVSGQGLRVMAANSNVPSTLEKEQVGSSD